MTEQTTIPDIIIKQNTRILMPTEYEKLRSAMISPQNKQFLESAIASGNQSMIAHHQRYEIVCDAMLLTGMRFIEFENMTRAWYSGPRRVIQLPKDASRKVRGKYTERTIMLSLPGCDAVERYFQSGLHCMERHAMNWSLKYYARQAGIGDSGIAVKMFRKTFVSWLVACFPDMIDVIAASMGHTPAVMKQHYLVLGFPNEEIRKMKEIYLKDFGMRL